jgi:uncharacterized protein (TIGR03435 family)
MRVRIALVGLLVLAFGSSRRAANAQNADAATSAAPAYVPTMTFDVASVHATQPAASYTLTMTDNPHSSMLRLQNFDLFNILTNAYGIANYQLVGVPDNWPTPAMFTIVAKSDAEMDAKLAKLSMEDARLEKQHALQTLLAERFKLQAHWETRESEVYNLVVVKGGHKLRPAGSMPPMDAEKKWMGVEADGQPKVFPIHQQCDWPECSYFGHSCPVDQLISDLSAQFGRAVIDKTGLAGKYDFVVTYHGATDRDRKADDTDPTLPLDSAIRAQLGLQVEPAKGPVRVLVIDHIEKPTEN